MYQSVSDAHYYPSRTAPSRAPDRHAGPGALADPMECDRPPCSQGEERQALEQHLAELDAELRNAISHPAVRRGS